MYKCQLDVSCLSWRYDIFFHDQSYRSQNQIKSSHQTFHQNNRLSTLMRTSTLKPLWSLLEEGFSSYLSIEDAGLLAATVVVGLAAVWLSWSHLTWVAGPYLYRQSKHSISLISTLLIKTVPNPLYSQNLY